MSHPIELTWATAHVECVWSTNEYEWTDPFHDLSSSRSVLYWGSASDVIWGSNSYEWDHSLDSVRSLFLWSTATNVIWGDNPYNWADLFLIEELIEIIAPSQQRRGGSSGKQRQKALDTWLRKQPEIKKKRVITLICKVKGYDEVRITKEVADGKYKVKVKDVELLISHILPKITVEI